MAKTLSVFARYREAKNLKPAELAEKLGVSRAAISRYEAGRIPARSLWPRFSRILGISEAALAGLEDWQPPKEGAK